MDLKYFYKISGRFFSFLDTCWQDARLLYHSNYTLFDILFLLTYFIEQLSLIYFLSKYPQYGSIIIGAFAIFVLTTISIQKTMLDSKNKAVKDAYTDLYIGYERLYKQYHDIIKLESLGEILLIGVVTSNS